MATLTSANSSFMLSIPDVLPNPVPIYGYAADDAFDNENVSPNETVMGVDGILSGGFTPYPVPLSFVLQADSPAIPTMDQWLAQMDADKEAYIANVSIVVPGIGKQFNFTKGFLTADQKFPSAHKIMQPQKFTITFESLVVTPYSN